MTPLNEQPTHLFVKNILGVPDNYEQVFASLTAEQRLGLALIRIADDIGNIRDHGCNLGVNDRVRIARLERWLVWTLGAVGGIGGAGAVALFVFAAIKFLKGG